MPKTPDIKMTPAFLKQVRETVRAELHRQRNQIDTTTPPIVTPFNWSWARTTEAVAAGTEAAPTSTTLQLRKTLDGSTWINFGSPVAAEHPWDVAIAANTLVIAVPAGNVWNIWVANCEAG